MSPRRPPHQAAGRRRDAAFLLPALCALLMLPPFVNLFVREVLVWGMPLDMVYLFGIWFVLVIGAFLLSRGLAEPGTGPPRRSDEAGRGCAETPSRGGDDA
ncbi:hypothetical protein GI374_06190 [Paracoccus sp. S-4012]|uniref:hypothetical protein n=1 Tax=Paracoccus sp. S-4012 TaxID=2665648 RepID=UPI0012AF8EBB|nr:hypothetical protein [Paracoccus sp. S-4012]MRX50047.1 hypothetical protein [Paracoccus sp. S-4012]